MGNKKSIKPIIALLLSALIINVVVVVFFISYVTNNKSDLRIQSSGETVSPEYTINELAPQISISYKPSLFNKDLSKKTTSELFLFGSKILSLHLIQNGKAAEQAVYSFYLYDKGRVYLIPAGGLGPNLDLEVRYKTLFSTQRVKFSTPKYLPTDKDLARVRQWYPLGPVVPENTLLYYALLNTPIELSNKKFQYIDMLDSKGTKLENVWAGTGIRDGYSDFLPLMIHPGRIKIGVKLRELFGPVMKAGNSYTIVINKEGFKDGFFRPMGESASKTYIAGPYDKTLPKFLENKSRIPRVGTKEPLMLAFSEAMNYDSIRQAIYIYKNSRQEILATAQNNKYGEPVITKGNRIEIENVTHETNDSRWIFTPKEPWGSEAYTVDITKEVRDLAYNALFLQFEVRSAEDYNKEHSLIWQFIPK